MRLITDSPQYPPYDYEGECAKIDEWITTPPDSLIRAYARWIEIRDLNANKSMKKNLSLLDKLNLTFPKLDINNCSHLSELTPQISNSCRSRRLDFSHRRSHSSNLHDSFGHKLTNNDGNIGQTSLRRSKRRANVEKDGNFGENAPKRGKIEKMEEKNAEIKDKNVEIVSLYKWNVVVNSGKVFIEGFKKGDFEPKKWQTSRIEQRIKRNVVRSVSGTDYRLVGRIVDGKRNGEGIPKNVAEKFVEGFPVNWKKLLLETNTKLCEGRLGKINSDANSSGMEKSIAKIDVNSHPRTRSGRVVFPRLAHWEHPFYKSQLDDSTCLANNPVEKQIKNPAATRRVKSRKKAPEVSKFQLPRTKEANTKRLTPSPARRRLRRRSESKTPTKANIGDWRPKNVDTSSGPASRTRSRTKRSDDKRRTSPVKMFKAAQKSAKTDTKINLFPKVVLTRQDLVQSPGRDAKTRRNLVQTPEKEAKTRRKRTKSPPKGPETTKLAKSPVKMVKIAKTPTKVAKVANVPSTRRKTSPKRTKSPQKPPKPSLKPTKTLDKRTQTPRNARTTSPKRTTPVKRTTTPQKRAKSTQKPTKPAEKRTKTPQNRPKMTRKSTKSPEKRSKSPEKRTRTPSKVAKTRQKRTKSSQRPTSGAQRGKSEPEKLVPLVTARPGTLTHHRQVLDAIRHQNENFEADFFSASTFDVSKIINLPTRSSMSDLECMSDSSSAMTPNVRIPLPKPASRHRTPEPDDPFSQPLPDELFRRKEVDSYIHNRRKKGQGPHVHERFRKKSTDAAIKCRKAASLDMPKSVLQFDSSLDKDDFRDEDDDSDFYFED